MHTNRYMYHGHWIPFRRSNLLSYQAMSSTRTKSQICTAAPISLLVQCQVSFHYPSINSPINLYMHTHIMYQIVWVGKLQKSNCGNNRVETLFSSYRISFCAYFCDFLAFLDSNVNLISRDSLWKKMEENFELEKDFCTINLLCHVLLDSLHPLTELL